MEFGLPDQIPLHILRILDQAVRALDEGDGLQAAMKLELARRAAVEADSQAAILAVHQLLGVLTFQSGDVDTALKHQQYVLQRSHAMGLQLGVASALHNLGLIAATKGDFAEANALFDHAIRYYNKLGKFEAAEKVWMNRNMCNSRWVPFDHPAFEHSPWIRTN